MEKEVNEENDHIVAIIVTILMIAITIVALIIFQLDSINSALFIFLMTVIYLALLFLLLEKKKVKEIIKTITQVIEKPIIKSIEVEKPVYIETKKQEKKELKYVASSQTTTYHRSSCRLSKLIKDKYKLESDKSSDFTKENFNPCKVCLMEIKKV